MSIVLGYLCVLSFCALMAKMITNRFHLQKADKILAKIHKELCAIFSVLCIFHIVSVFPVLKTRHISVLISGISIPIAAVLLIVLCHTIKQKKRNLLSHRFLSIVMLICILEHILIYFIDFRNYQTKINNIRIGEATISAIKDGKYTGDYDAGYIYAKVAVTVKDGEIININILRHDNEKGSLAEKIVDKVIEEQRINIDAISGATNSSLVIEKAIENALRQSVKNTAY